MLEELSPKRILIEAPPGLKTYILTLGQYIAKKLSNKLRLELTYTLRSCWGFCDTDIYSLLLDRYDLILHVGHVLTPNLLNIMKENIPEVRKIQLDLDKVVLEVKDKTVLGWSLYRKIYREQLEVLTRVLEKENIEVIFTVQQYLPHVLNSVKILNKNIEVHLITGCYIPNIVDRKIIVASSGFFHSITPLIYGINSTNIVSIDMETCRDNTQECIKRFKYLLTLKLSILSEKLREDSRIGILLSCKVGQRRYRRALELYNYLKNLYSNTYIFEVDEVSEDVLRQVQVDCYINTTCPRLGFDDLDRLNLKIINIDEVKYITGLEALSNYDIRSIIRGY